MSRERIGIYGGTFSPPHKGHVISSAAAAEKLGLDTLYVIPASVPPHKDLPVGTPGPEQRMEMTRLAFSEIPCAVASDMELTRTGKSYTIDTVEEIMRLHPDAEVFLLMGTDMFLTLESWYRGADLMRLLTPVVSARGGDDTDALMQKAAEYREKYGADCVVLPPVLDISSTEIRTMLPQRGGCAYLCESVYGYIIDNRLYCARADFDWLRSKAYAMLDLKRIPHVAGCEQEAVHLARRWGEDVDSAREAAILHDITKKHKSDGQLRLCDEYDIMIDNTERNEYKLLHSKTGAAIARRHFAVSDEVCSAIESHTTGKPDMTLLEKIIYLADYIEPTRSFDGLDRLRQLSYTDIDAAMILGLQMSIEDMLSRGIVPHARSSSALEYLLSDKR